MLESKIKPNCTACMTSQPLFQFSAVSPRWIKRGTIALLSLLSFTFGSASLQSAPLPTIVSQATSAPAAASPRPVLKPGSQGEAVSELQAMLRLLGYYTGAIDGVYQDNTATAVAAFQQAAGLQADGVVGTATWVRLLPPSPVAAAVPASSPASSSAPSPAPRGSSSSANSASPPILPSTSSSRAPSTGSPANSAAPAASTPSGSASFPTPSSLPSLAPSPSPAASSAASPAAPAVRNPAAIAPAATASPAPTASPSASPTSAPIQTGTQSGTQPIATTVDFPTLRVGMRGSAVSGLQMRLQAIGVFSGTIDGVFGTETQDAVKAAQQKFNLESDGVVGSATWAALMQ